MPKRIQLSRTKGWRKPEGAVVVSRPSKWGNPFAQICPDGWRHRVLCHVPTQTPILTMGCFEVSASDKKGERENAKFCFESWINGSHVDAQKMRAELTELRGKDLACWCPIDQPCHGDVLLQLANAPIRAEKGET